MSGVTILLAPSKTLDFTSPLPFDLTATKPLFLADAAKISTVLQRKSTKQLMKMMSISQPIAETVKGYFQDWSLEKSGRPAAWTYVGDVYKGFKAKELSLDDVAWAQQHLLILSGLYGVLHPLDSMQAYRLEMKVALPIGRKRNLVSYWDNKLAAAVMAQGTDWICNCCSNEYAGLILKHIPNTTMVVTPFFMDNKPNGSVGVVPIYSKMMRGVLARWLIDQRVTQPAQLRLFSAHGYSYDASRSTLLQPVFYRQVMTPLQF